MKSIPFFHDYNSDSKQLTLRGARYFPREVFDFAEQIEILDMSKGALTELPTDFSRLKHLKVAFFSQNDFTSVPEVLSQCSQLRVVGFKSCRINVLPATALPPQLGWLILTDNQLISLPDSIGGLVGLKKLALAGNRIRSLPESLLNCRALELLRIGANDLSKSPAPWLCDLPALAWYCDSGNPFSCVLETPGNEISFSEIDYGEQIGGSPTSLVYRARLNPSGQEIAAKHYHGPLTSDGYAVDDIAASLAISDHPNLIKGVGKIVCHPEGKLGIAFELIPSSFSPLGAPPNFSTITRDTFPNQPQFTRPFVWQVLLDVSSALHHLHSRQMSHGDIYAHNILADARGRSLLGDFGAASIYDSSVAKKRERIEVRAFGHLVEDLLGQIDQSFGDQESLKKLLSLCLNADSYTDATFSQVNQFIQSALARS